MATNNLKQLKSDLISEIEKRMADNIIESTNATLLKKLINGAETTTDALAIAELGTTYKRTGFHFDKRLEVMGETIKYLKKNEELSFINDKENQTHKLIIGDNYDALLNLMISHKGLIDVIYIDPPYGKDSMGDFAKTNYTNGLTRDNLLSMLYPRLQLAKQLLSDKGVIFCSIDDKNQAYIKCLLDEVFGEEKFISNITTVNNLKGRSDDKFFATATEYLLVYCKNTEYVKISGFDMNDDENAEYKLDDSISNYKLVGLKKTGKNCYKEDRPNMFYSIYYSPKNDNLSLTKDFEDSLVIYPTINNRDGRWRWGKETFLEKCKTELICKISNDNYVVYVKMRNVVDGEARTIKPKTIWQNPKYDTGNGTKLIKSILGEKIFDSPKPVDYIKDILLVSTKDKKNAIILDYFAGSGTTGQAVMELNKEDGGNRQFILCTNNEINDLNPNGIAFDVTSKRLKRVMSGECYDGSKDFKWIEKDKPYLDNLEVLDISEVKNNEQSEGKNPFDVIDETLYELPKFVSIQEKINWVCSNFENTQKYLKED